MNWRKVYHEARALTTKEGFEFFWLNYGQFILAAYGACQLLGYFLGDN